jgi:two-component system sensor histidine kinase AlgZ
MIIALGDFLRLTLEDHAAPMRSLGEELEFLKLYVAIEQMRLGDRLTVEYTIAPETVEAKLPYLLLQPLMENAIRHGAARISRPATIRLRTRSWNGDLRVVLENDGPKGTREVKIGVGLSNTLERLRLHYGEGFQFNLMDRPEGGCVASLTVPYHAARDSGSPNGLHLEPDMSGSHR